jgi:diadenylate cyclase
MMGLFRWQDFLDIFIISFVVYRLLVLLVDTRAMQLVKGIFVLGLLAAAARVFELQALSWLLAKSLTGLFIAIPIVFQPELRRVLEELGRGKIWQRRQAQEKAEQLADEITRALIYLQSQKMGGLLVLERTTGLRDVWRTAVKIDGEISQELIVSLFWPNNPLHDGAVIVNKDRILAAACYLPLTENSNLSRWLGTRHRAALGVTEVSDAISLIVSEERGEISLAIKGHLSRGLKEKQVRRLLLHYFLAKEEQEGGFWDQLRRELRDLWPGSGEKDEV